MNLDLIDHLQIEKDNLSGIKSLYREDTTTQYQWIYENGQVKLLLSYDPNGFIVMEKFIYETDSRGNTKLICFWKNGTWEYRNQDKWDKQKPKKFINKYLVSNGN